ncbi:hypothetical protein AKJ16_DCAP10301 [Drosera capensis]
MDHLAIRGVASSGDHFMKIGPVHNSSARRRTCHGMKGRGIGGTQVRRHKGRNLAFLHLPYVYDLVLACTRKLGANSYNEEGEEEDCKVRSSLRRKKRISLSCGDS